MVHDLVDARVEVLAGVVAVLDVAEAPRPVREVIGELRQRQLELLVAELLVAERGAQRLARPDGGRAGVRVYGLGLGLGLGLG